MPGYKTMNLLLGVTIWIARRQRKKTQISYTLSGPTVKPQNTNNLFLASRSVIPHNAPNSESISVHKVVSCSVTTASRAMFMQSLHFLFSWFMSNSTF